MQVNLRQEVAAQFTPETASIAFFGALYTVRCLTKRVQLLGSRPTQPEDSLLSGLENLYTQVRLSPSHLVQTSILLCNNFNPVLVVEAGVQ